MYIRSEIEPTNDKASPLHTLQHNQASRSSEHYNSDNRPAQTVNLRRLLRCVVSFPKTYNEGDQTTEPLFVVAAAEPEPVALVLALELVIEASTLAIELEVAAAASTDDSATKA